MYLLNLGDILHSQLISGALSARPRKQKHDNWQRFKNVHGPSCCFWTPSAYFRFSFA
jgi:hypothetical protein